jgi:CHAD domain-containing protein
MAVGHHREREVTYDVDAEWALPDLSDAVPEGGRLAEETNELRAVYYDTEPAVLRPLGISLRRREGGADAGWHLKVPAGDSRSEVHSHAGPGTVPPALARRVAGITSSRRLAPVATIETTRHTAQVLDARGGLVLEVAEDQVRGTRERSTSDPVEWREVEIELGDAGTEDDLAAVADRLEAAGARPAAVQRKINHVLGEPPGLQIEGVAGLVAGYLRDQCTAILVGDVLLRDDPAAESVHHTRIAVRRLRSSLRLFSHVVALPEGELSRLDADLRWLGSLLSPVRDCDILSVRLTRELERLRPEDVVGPVRREVGRALARERATAVERWREVRDGERYLSLLLDLVGWYAAPPVREDAPLHPQRVLRRARRQERRRLEAAEDAHGLHRARKAAKRLRYAAELLAPALDGADVVAKKAKRQQTRWGKHQDLVVAAAFLRRLADPVTPPGVRSGFTYGVLVARLDRQAAKIRRRAMR